MKRPSATASATTRHMSEPERMASSLPGMTKSMTSGSQLVSTTATTGSPSLRASVTAICSFLVSMTNTALGRRSRSAMPPEVAAQLLELAGVLQRLALGHAVEVAGRLHGA